MKRKNYKKVRYVLTCAGVIIGITIMVGLAVCDSEDTKANTYQTNDILVYFDITGTIRVTVPDTNCGEVPDEAWEQARRLLSKCDELKDIKFETVAHTLLTTEYDRNKGTKTDKNKYAVSVIGIVKGDNTEEAKEHFWEDICSEVNGNWCIVEIENE